MCALDEAKEKAQAVRMLRFREDPADQAARFFIRFHRHRMRELRRVDKIRRRQHECPVLRSEKRDVAQKRFRKPIRVRAPVIEIEKDVLGGESLREKVRIVHAGGRKIEKRPRMRVKRSAIGDEKRFAVGHKNEAAGIGDFLAAIRVVDLSLLRRKRPGGVKDRRRADEKCVGHALLPLFRFRFFHYSTSGAA